MKLEKERIGITQIEEMFLLADDVLRALHMNASSYTNQGEEIFDLYYDAYKEDEDMVSFHKVICAEREKNAEHEHLIYGLLHNEEYNLSSVLDLSAEEILAKYLAPIMDKVINIFRHGTSCGDTDYVADESVPDDYLKALFSMRLRDRMIVFASQRLEKKYYFLTWGTHCCHDMDEWIGIYDDISKLRVDYNEVIAKKDSKYNPETLQIFEFTANSWEHKQTFPEELWGEVL